ncbi:MAG: DNA polymerase Y family protein [Actinomycetaceae bacterium]|nr:DNA polymerase Y family protein [Actinomycetaceae bacterium]
MSRIAIVFFPDWETNALVIDCPPGAPAALISPRGRVTHATREAKSFGVQVGMRRALAEHLCPDLLVMPEDPSRSARSFNVVLEALDEVSATVCVIRPGVAWLPASAARTCGGEEAMAELIIDTIAERTGSECYVGIGEGVLNAWVGALHGVRDPQQRLVEELNLAHLRPLIPGREADVRQVLESLQTLGVNTVSDLRKLGAGHVLARFGSVGQSLYRLLWQGEPLVKASAVPDESVEQVLDFPSPVSDLGIVLGFLLEQATTLVDRLVSRQVAPRAIDVAAVIVGSDGEMSRVRRWAIIDFPAPRDLVDRTRWQVQAWVDELARKETEEWSQEVFGVKTVSLSAQSLVPIDDLAKRLWGERSKEDARSSATAFRLQALVGVDGVIQPRIREGFDPLTKVVESSWGALEEVAAWEGRVLPEKWAAHASFQERWVGGLEGESPETVLEEELPVRLFDDSGGLVRLRGDGTINAAPRSMVVDSQGAGDLGLGLSAQEEVSLIEVRGPWPILGKWWEAGEESSRAWLIVQPLDLPRMLLKWFSGRWVLAALWY